jgi:hypothetical protein
MHCEHVLLDRNEGPAESHERQDEADWLARGSGSTFIRTTLGMPLLNRSRERPMRA